MMNRTRIPAPPPKDGRYLSSHRQLCPQCDGLHACVFARPGDVEETRCGDCGHVLNSVRLRPAVEAPDERCPDCGCESCVCE